MFSRHFSVFQTTGLSFQRTLPQKLIKLAFPIDNSTFQVIFDCSFDHRLNEKKTKTSPAADKLNFCRRAAFRSPTQRLIRPNKCKYRILSACIYNACILFDLFTFDVLPKRLCKFFQLPFVAFAYLYVLQCKLFENSNVNFFFLMHRQTNFLKMLHHAKRHLL